jgi:protein-S-isoprenylcysteine O-methyltransferase Ste14
MEKRLTKNGVKALIAPIRWTMVMAVAFFLAAGRIGISRAWIFFGLYLAGAFIGAIIMWKLAPELANQRGSIKEGTKTWDKILLWIYFPVSLLGFPIVAGLDVARYRWSQLGDHYIVVGILLYVGSFVLVYWAMVVNEHFEASARIQEERGHKVITKGPYRFVRHPGYLGMILGGLSGSLTIGSLYSLFPSVIAVIAVVVRTHLEDLTLRKELGGYTEYAEKTRYRLFPGLW